MDGEYETDARRLIWLRCVDDRWRRIDRLPVVVTGLIPTVVVAAGLMPAAWWIVSRRSIDR
jgi:hypothetical protein